MYLYIKGGRNMKICMVILSIIMMLATNVSMADEPYAVNFFGNVHFGMKIEEVSLALSAQNIPHKRKDTSITLLATINGCENSYVNYYFDDNDRLNDVRYSMPSEHFESEDELLAHFKALEDKLLAKYGSTEYTMATGQGLLFREKRFESGRKSVFGMYWTDNILDRSERIVEYGDGTYLVIDHYCLVTDTEFGDKERTLNHNITYENYLGDLPLFDEKHDSTQSFDDF